MIEELSKEWGVPEREAQNRFANWRWHGIKTIPDETTSGAGARMPRSKPTPKPPEETEEEAEDKAEAPNDKEGDGVTQDDLDQWLTSKDEDDTDEGKKPGKQGSLF